MFLVQNNRIRGLLEKCTLDHEARMETLHNVLRERALFDARWKQIQQDTNHSVSVHLLGLSYTARSMLNYFLSHNFSQTLLLLKTTIFWLILWRSTWLVKKLMLSEGGIFVDWLLYLHITYQHSGKLHFLFSAENSQRYLGQFFTPCFCMYLR